MIEHDAFGILEMKQLCDNIYMEIIETHSSIRDSDVYHEYGQLLNDISQNKIEIEDFITCFLKMSFSIIDNIYCDIILVSLYAKGVLKCAKK